MNRWLDATAAADKLGYRNRAAFYKAVARHGIPYTRIGSVMRFSEATLERWMEMQHAKQMHSRFRRAG